jgi:hypothetical protein
VRVLEGNLEPKALVHAPEALIDARAATVKETQKIPSFDTDRRGVTYLSGTSRITPSSNGYVTKCCT